MSRPKWMVRLRLRPIDVILAGFGLLWVAGNVLRMVF